jgi:hypothetical protein
MAKKIKPGLGGKSGRAVNADIMRRLAALQASITSPAEEIVVELARIAQQAPPDGCDQARWERLINHMADWARSFGDLSVWDALERAGGDKMASVRLHHRTLPDLRRDWMTRELGYATHTERIEITPDDLMQLEMSDDRDD